MQFPGGLLLNVMVLVVILFIAVYTLVLSHHVHGTGSMGTGPSAVLNSGGFVPVLLLGRNKSIPRACIVTSKNMDIEILF